MEERVCLVIVAHPDDAELAMGGTLQKLKANGIRTVVAVISTGLSDIEQKKRREKSAQKSADNIGFELIWPYALDYKQVEDIKTYDLVSSLDKLISEYSPSCIFSHWEHDSHTDHRLIANALLASSRKTKADIIAFPPADLSTSQAYVFSPNYFVDISDYVDNKYKSIEMYNYLDRGYRSLNIDDYRRRDAYFGIVAQCSFSEAFLIIRKIS